MDNIVTDDEVVQVLADNVQQRLEALGWSGLRLAKESGEQQSLISRMLSKKNLISVGSVTRIARALNTTVDWLLDPRNCRTTIDA